MQFKMEQGNGESLIRALLHTVQTEGIPLQQLAQQSEIPMFDKYDPYIPTDLLRRAYAADRLRADEVAKRLEQMTASFDCGDKP